MTAVSERRAVEYQRERRKAAEMELRKKKLEKKVALFDSFMKVIVAIIVLHGLICVTASYVFAWHGIMEPLSSLSETIMREIVAPVVTYGLTKTVENVSKYNDWIEKYLQIKYGSAEGGASASNGVENSTPGDGSVG